MTAITDRIERDLGLPGLVSILAERLAPTDLQTLLLEVYRRRAAKKNGPAIQADYEKNRFLQPAQTSPTKLLDWERLAFSMLPEGFVPLELSPVCPIGACSAVAGVSQDWAVSTSRNTEVVSDATNGLALECARQRRTLLRSDPRSSEPVHLAASHRLLRAQRYADPRLQPPFRLFGLASAGRDHGGRAFEVAAIGLHLRFYLAATGKFIDGRPKLQLVYSVYVPAAGAEPAFWTMLDALLIDFPTLECMADPDRSAGRSYYQGLSFHLNTVRASGEVLLLVDGGAVDWTAKLTGNAKERLVTSGVGTERLCAWRDETAERALPEG